MKGSFKPSRLRWRDLLVESWLEVSRRPGRSFLTGLGVALGCAAIVGTLTLTSTTRFQVSDSFDAKRATQVEARLSTDSGAYERQQALFPPDQLTLQRLENLSGVEGVAVIRETLAPVNLAINSVVTAGAIPNAAALFGINWQGLQAMGIQVEGEPWGEWHEERHERVLLLSKSVAERLGIFQVAAGDHLYLNHVKFTVLGVISESPRIPALAAGVLVPISTVQDLFELDPDRDRVVWVAAPGGARQIAEVAAVALSPENPRVWSVYAPADDNTLRRSVDEQIQALALGLGFVVAALGMVSIGTSTLTSVLQRINEIGLRRALGARPRHIAAHVLFDATILGAVGGITGAITGVGVTVAVSLAKAWVPVVDPLIPLISVVGAIGAGLIAGVYPAWYGSRLQPTEALKRD